MCVTICVTSQIKLEKGDLQVEKNGSLGTRPYLIMLAILGMIEVHQHSRIILE